MSDITEGLGTAIEGALLGRAVDRKRGGTGEGEPSDGACLNCGEQPLGNFCQNCGQKVHVHRTLSAIGHDIIHGVLHLDGKFWKTLPLLLFRPGKLTRRYIDGERAKFVSPMAMFLFSVFIMFAVFQAMGLSAPTNISGDTPAQLREFAETEIKRLEAQTADLARQVDEAAPGSDVRASLELELAEAQDQLEALTLARQEIPFLSGAPAPQSGPQEEVVGGVPVRTEEDGSTTIPLSVDGNAQMNIGTSDVEWIAKSLEKWRTNPSLMLTKMQNNAYKFSWLLIPISIPFVWLLFLFRRRFKAYDHAVFVTYSISFVSLLFIAMSVTGAIGMPTVALILIGLLVPPVHMFVHLRGTYELGWFGALWRLLALSVFIWIVLILFLQALLLLGAF